MFQFTITEVFDIIDQLISDIDLLKDLGIAWNLGKAPYVMILHWRPPPIVWIKVNSDGLAKGNPGAAA